MRAAGVASIVIASLFLLPLPATSPADRPVTGPTLTVGDAWTYRSNTSLGTGFYFDGRATLTIERSAPATVEGSTFQAYYVSVTGSGIASGTLTTDFGSAPASGTWYLVGEEIVESEGLLVVSSVLDLEANGTLQPISVGFQLSVQNSTTYRFWEDSWRFPFAINDSTVVRTQMNFSQDFRVDYGFPTTPVHSAGLVWWNVSYAFEAATVVSVPAGRFDAYRMRQTFPDGSFALRFYAPAAGNDVRSEAYDSTGPVATTELVSYRYQVLEPKRFLGLTASDWTIIAILAAAAVVSVFLLRRWMRRPAQPPPSPPPVSPPPGPP